MTDYKAILPYLKELEEQLKEQAEAKEQKKDDTWFEVSIAPDTEEVKKEVKHLRKYFL